ncbi:recombinase family protein [Metabacillus sediminilitoris]|uniref:Recombinase family protein n=1 Tax=Metabacillus sediminilitoris TaxID=2567941 RepID=A0A4S4BZ76_9BACI|nr:recombinase family protein [Metabacillus sediminilitoris]QGQ47255.1 recombinase family protein [Metabacillus sediminilitoris]THF80597.1 recombinase family protein [Metabacillus sediminilitoris]
MIYNNENIKHVCVYLRLSRDEEGKGIDEVLKNHRETLIDLVKKNKWSYEVFEEVASSSTIEKREEMVKLIKRIEQYHFDAVVVMDIDRLSRNEFDQSDIKRLLFNTGTFIVTPYRLYDLRSDDDSLLLGITGLIASQEYKMILKRMQRGKMFAQKQGHWTNGKPPLAYDKDVKTKKLVPNKHAEDVRFIFNEVVGGTTIPAIVEQLKTMGVKTKEGKPFHYNAIVRLINNECYKGTLISNRGIGKNEGIKPKEEWIVINNCHEAIVDENVWEKANKIVNEYSFKAPRSKNRIYPTSNLIYCGQCGKLQGCNNHKRLGKIYIKVCKCGNRTFYYNPILKLIKEKVQTHKETILEAIQGIEEGSEEDNTEYKIKHLTKQIEKVQKALENINILFEEGEIDLLTYKERKAKRQTELKEIEKEIQEVHQNDVSVKKVGLQEQLKIIERLYDKWEILEGDGLTDEEINRMLHLLIEKIYWTYEKGSTEPTIKITYK